MTFLCVYKRFVILKGNLKDHISSVSAFNTIALTALRGLAFCPPTLCQRHKRSPGSSRSLGSCEEC